MATSADSDGTERCPDKVNKMASENDPRRQKAEQIKAQKELAISTSQGIAAQFKTMQEQQSETQKVEFSELQAMYG